MTLLSSTVLNVLLVVFTLGRPSGLIPTTEIKLWGLSQSSKSRVWILDLTFYHIKECKKTYAWNTRQHTCCWNTSLHVFHFTTDDIKQKSYYEWFPWSICNGCGMPAGNAYHSGHLVPSPFLGSCLWSSCWELAVSFLDFSHWIPLGTFSILH